MAISCVHGTKHNSVFFILTLMGTQLMAGMFARVRLWQSSVLALIHKLVKMLLVGLLDTPKYLGWKKGFSQPHLVYFIGTC